MKQKLFDVLLKISLFIFTRLMLYSMLRNHRSRATSFKQRGRIQSFVFRSFTSQKKRLIKGLLDLLMLIIKRLVRRGASMGPLSTEGVVYKEEELQQIGRFPINPSPNDGRCDVCGKHISELNPFGGSGNPLLGNFSGALLVKRWRPEGPYNPEAEKARKEAEKEVPDGEDPLPWFVSKYGEEKGNRLYGSAVLYNDYSRPSWECRNCVCLGTNGYFEVIDKRLEENTSE